MSIGKDTALHADKWISLLTYSLICRHLFRFLDTGDFQLSALALFRLGPSGRLFREASAKCLDIREQVFEYEEMMSLVLFGASLARMYSIAETKPSRQCKSSSEPYRLKVLGAIAGPLPPSIGRCRLCKELYPRIPSTEPPCLPFFLMVRCMTMQVRRAIL